MKKKCLYFLMQDIIGGQVHEFQVHRPFKTPRSYQLKIGDEAIEAPMVSKGMNVWSVMFNSCHSRRISLFTLVA